jgi:predicted nucleic acid-binding protein
VRKYVLDTNCYIDASRDREALAALTRFASWSAPGLFLSSVVAAELRAGARSAQDRKGLEKDVLGPFVRRGRVLTPSASGWDALGLTLSVLREEEGLHLSRVQRGFALDILLAYSCRENGAVLVTRNARDMVRIRRVFAFEHVAPYPEPT